jgi:proteic killer suppression protein
MAIKSFSDEMTADVAKGLNTKAARRLPQTVWRVARRKLDAIDAARTTLDLSPLQIEALTETKPGYLAARVNDQYRIHFRFIEGNAYDVGIIGEDHTGRRGR